MSDLWIREHGHAYDVPAKVLELVARKQLFDASYHNDTCPRFDTTTGDEPGRTLWIEHPEPSERELDGPRFVVQSYDADYDSDGANLIETDDLEAALEVLLEGTYQRVLALLDPCVPAQLLRMYPLAEEIARVDCDGKAIGYTVVFVEAGRKQIANVVHDGVSFTEDSRDEAVPIK